MTARGRNLAGGGGVTTMTEREMTRRILALEQEVRGLRRQLGSVPARFALGGGGGLELPPGTGRGKVLTIIDDGSPGTVGWDWVRFWNVPAGEQKAPGKDPEDPDWDIE